MGIKISCDEASKICDKNQYKEASLIEKIKLNIHLFLCKNCKLYSKQNKVLTKCIHGYEKNSPNKNCECLHDSEKKEMEQNIELEIHRH
ncbi:MAG: hypothetical protein ACWA42_07445 [Lutibacter sp.]